MKEERGYVIKYNNIGLFELVFGSRISLLFLVVAVVYIFFVVPIKDIGMLLTFSVICAIGSYFITNTNKIVRNNEMIIEDRSWSFLQVVIFFLFFVFAHLFESFNISHFNTALLVVIGTYIFSFLLVILRLLYSPITHNLTKD